MQRKAPKNIKFQNIVITTKDYESHKDALYIHAGVTNFSLEDSTITGKNRGVPIYLDAESAHNTIKNSNIWVDTNHREQLAIDGSAYNKIIGNRFSNLKNGGIYIYRNCGEGGNPRLQRPWFNQIIGNHFNYTTYDGDNPAIWVSSRIERVDGQLWNTKSSAYMNQYFYEEIATGFGAGRNSYCNLDRRYGTGHSYGSDVSDFDHAKHTVIAENQFRNRNPGSWNMIRRPYGKDSTSQPVHIYFNERVSTSNINRHDLGCFIDFGGGFDGGFGNDVGGGYAYLHHGGEYTIEPRTSLRGRKYTCFNNNVVSSEFSNWPISIINFYCQHNGFNDSCRKTISCPSGKRVAAVRAVCDLTSRMLPSNSALHTMPWNSINIRNPLGSIREDGACAVHGHSISVVRQGFVSIGNRTDFDILCRNHFHKKANCAMKGEVICL